MSGIDFELKGNKLLDAALKKMPDEVQREVSKVVMRTAADLEADVKIRIQQGPATGRVYTRGNVTHQASARGEAPASDTGALLGSIYHERVSRLFAVAGSRMVYAAALELGSRKIEKRPAWVPAIKAIGPQYIRDMAAAIRRATR